MDNNILDWNGVLENDGTEYIVLDEGDYNFTVTGFERGTYPGSEKIPPCNKAVLTLSVDSPKGTATAKCDLILYRTLEWKLSAFFRAIGQKKHGERLTMNWDKVPGSRGRAHFKPRPFTGKDGSEKFANEVDSFIDYDEAFFAAPTWVKEADAAPEAPPVQQSWTQGGF